MSRFASIVFMEFELNPIPPFKATYLSLSARQKFFTILTILSLFTFLLPNKTAAALVKPPSQPLVFVIGDYTFYLNKLNLQLGKIYELNLMNRELARQLVLQQRVKDYLAAQNSPLADYVPVLLNLNNWKKIIALSSAESGFCKYYPVNKANCWGIGGANLWYMGSNLGEGISSMDLFLKTYPNHSSVKYSEMTFRQMNGLYKQPAASHWVDNNEAIYDDLTAIENFTKRL